MLKNHLLKIKLSYISNYVTGEEEIENNDLQKLGVFNTMWIQSPMKKLQRMKYEE